MTVDAAEDRTSQAKRAKKKQPDAATRCMDSAETLFLRLGYEGASLRAITARAKVSLGTIVYHWKTKEELFRDVCIRRFGSVVEEQLSRLRACEADFAGPTSEHLEKVLRSLVEPPLLRFRETEAANTTRLLYGRVLTDPSPVVLRITAEIFSDPSDLYWKLVRKHLPDLDHEIFYWRYTCAIGSFIFAQSFGHRIAYAAHFDLRATDWAIVADEIIASMLASLERPA